jgi:hypothetical protein
LRGWLFKLADARLRGEKLCSELAVLYVGSGLPRGELRHLRLQLPDAVAGRVEQGIHLLVVRSLLLIRSVGRARF